MVFHGDYEIDFEIYEQREGDWRSRLLGHMASTLKMQKPGGWKLTKSHQIGTASSMQSQHLKNGNKSRRSSKN